MRFGNTRASGLQLKSISVASRRSSEQRMLVELVRVSCICECWSASAGEVMDGR